MVHALKRRSDVDPTRMGDDHRQWCETSWKTHVRILAHVQRCKPLPALLPGEAERLVASFIATKGVTRYPPAFAAAGQQG